MILMYHNPAFLPSFVAHYVQLLLGTFRHHPCPTMILTQQPQTFQATFYRMTDQVSLVLETEGYTGSCSKRIRSLQKGLDQKVSTDRSDRFSLRIIQNLLVKAVVCSDFCMRLPVQVNNCQLEPQWSVKSRTPYNLLRAPSTVQLSIIVLWIMLQARLWRCLQNYHDAAIFGSCREKIVLQDLHLI